MEKVYWCSQCGVAEVTEEDRVLCLMCEGNVIEIGWVER